MGTENIKYVWDADTQSFKMEVEKADKAVKGLDKSVGTSQAKVRDFGKAATETGTKFKAVGSTFTNFGVKALAVGTAVSVGIGTMLKSFLSLESGLQVYEKVFEDGSKAVEDFYEANKYSITATRDEYRVFAGQIGDTLKPMGFFGDELDNTTANILEQAIALSQWKGIPVEQAITAITKSMLGEREMLKELGVAISDQDVKERALLMTGKEREDQLTQMDKAMATQALITERASDALENFGNLDRLQKLQVAFKLLKEAVQYALDKTLIPLLDKIIPKIQEFQTKMEDPAFKEFVVKMVQIATAVAAVSLVLGGISLVLGGVISTVGTFLTAFGAISSGISTVSTAFGSFSKIVGKVPGLLSTAFSGLSNFFAPITSLVSNFASTLFAPLTGAFSTFVSSIGGFLAPVTSLFAPLTGALSGLLGPLVGIAGSVLGAVAPFLALAGVIGLVVGLGSEIKRVWADVFDAEAIGQFKAIFGSIVDDVKAIFDALKGGDFDAVKEKFLSLGENLGEMFSLAVSKLLELLTAIDWGAVLQTAFDFIVGLGAFIISFISGIDWAGLLSQLAVFLLNTFTEVVSWLTEKLLAIDWIAMAGMAISALGALFVWLGEMLMSIDWPAVGLALWEALKAALGLIWALIKAIPWVQVGMALFNALISIPGKLLRLFVNVNWSSIGNKIWNAIKSIPGKLLNAFTSIDWGGVGSAIWNAIKSALSGIGSWVADKVKGVLGSDSQDMLQFATPIGFGRFGGEPGDNGITQVFNWTVNTSNRDISSAGGLHNLKARATIISKNRGDM